MRHDLFSTPVWHIEETPQKLVDELYQGAYKVKKKYPSNQMTNCGGYQSPAFEWEEFHPQGRKYITHTLKEAFAGEFTNASFPVVDYKVSVWWYNINNQAHWNIPHTHPKSDLALVLYLTDSDGLLTLFNPHAQRGIDKQNTSLNAKKGDIIIFPSDLIHYVMPNPREEDRISISMNLQLW